MSIALHGNEVKCAFARHKIVKRPVFRAVRAQVMRMSEQRFAMPQGPGGGLADHDAAHFGGHPTANGTLTRLAYAQAQATGLDLAPLLKKSNLSVHQIEDPAAPPKGSGSDQLRKSRRR